MPLYRRNRNCGKKDVGCAERESILCDESEGTTVKSSRKHAQEALEALQAERSAVCQQAIQDYLEYKAHQLPDELVAVQVRQQPGYKSVSSQV